MLKETFPAGPPTVALAVTVPRGIQGGCGGWTLGGLRTTVTPGDGPGDVELPAGVVCPLDGVALGLPAGVVDPADGVGDGEAAGEDDGEAAGEDDGEAAGEDDGEAAGEDDGEGAGD